MEDKEELEKRYWEFKILFACFLVGTIVCLLFNDDMFWRWTFGICVVVDFLILIFIRCLL